MIARRHQPVIAKMLEPVRKELMALRSRLSQASPIAGAARSGARSNWIGCLPNSSRWQREPWLGPPA